MDRASQRPPIHIEAWSSETLDARIEIHLERLDLNNKRGKAADYPPQENYNVRRGNDILLERRAAERRKDRQQSRVVSAVAEVTKSTPEKLPLNPLHGRMSPDLPSSFSSSVPSSALPSTESSAESSSHAPSVPCGT